MPKACAFEVSLVERRFRRCQLHSHTANNTAAGSPLAPPTTPLPLPLRRLQSPSVLILFAFEFAILCVSAACTLAKYALHLVDARMIEGTWHAKASYIFFLELASEVGLSL
jgi:hypothetical protein